MEEKNNKSNILRKILIAILIIVIISIVVTIGIGNFLFIHGDNDDFVPEYMCEKLYEGATCKKDKLIIHGAGHTESRYKEPETYYNKIFDFLDDVRI